MKNVESSEEEEASEEEVERVGKEEEEEEAEEGSENDESSEEEEASEEEVEMRNLPEEQIDAEHVRPLNTLERCWFLLPAFPPEATLDLMKFHSGHNLHCLDFDDRYAFIKGLKNNTHLNGTIVKIENFNAEKYRWEACPLDVGWVMNAIVGDHDEDGEVVEHFEQNNEGKSILLKEINVQQFSFLEYALEVNRIMDARSDS